MALESRRHLRQRVQAVGHERRVPAVGDRVEMRQRLLLGHRPVAARRREAPECQVPPRPSEAIAGLLPDLPGPLGGRLGPFVAEETKRLA